MEHTYSYNLKMRCIHLGSDRSYHIEITALNGCVLKTYSIITIQLGHLYIVTIFLDCATMHLYGCTVSQGGLLKIHRDRPALP